MRNYTIASLYLFFRAQLQGLTGQAFGSIIQVIATVVAGLTIAFYYGWELTLVTLSVVPFIAVGGALQLQVTNEINYHTSHNTF